MLRLFEGCGIEIEYMLVDGSTLDVMPIADRVLQAGARSDVPVNEFSRGNLGWSNELVMHVLELKNVQPNADLAALARRFQDEVVAMNDMLATLGARLMPGGMHPWMDPFRETRVWPHDNGPVYRAYDQLFDCRRHGWANLQSAHVNLPFANDAEFARLHAAVRLILPLLPALAAASPYVENRAADVLDGRMEAYRQNANAVPEMNGAIVPEIVMNRADYERIILKPLYRAIAPHDPEGVLQHEWLNARGAIARFDRNAIEIRVLDTQECPRIDVAFAALVMDLAQSLCEKELYRPAADTQLPTRMLAEIFVACVHDGERARVTHADYLAQLGLGRRERDSGNVWWALAERLDRENAPHAALWRETMEYVLTRGPLARRLLGAVGPRPSRAALHELYRTLADSLAAGTPFDP
jgi:glutamate---cysteine ligase / carboxylate-amine ligase